MRSQSPIASLEDCERILDYATQVVSIPDMKPVVKEIRRYITVCKQCGERIRSHAPRKRGSNAVVYDASVKSLVVYLSVVMFLPYGRIDNFFREVFGLEISQGSFVNWVNEAKKNAEPAIEKIKECIMKSISRSCSMGADARTRNWKVASEAHSKEWLPSPTATAPTSRSTS